MNQPNEPLDDRFIVECPYCYKTIVLLLPDTGHKTCPLCHKQFNTVNGQAEKLQLAIVYIEPIVVEIAPTASEWATW